MSERQSTVRFDNVSKAFGKIKILENASFEIDEGKALVILGRSGTGKSVTLKMMIGLLKPDQGEIFIHGKEITALDSGELSAVRKEMGFLFQNAALFDSISVGENVAFPLRRHGKFQEEEIRQRASQRLAQVSLEDAYDKMPSDLSGGMKKRAAMARALALDPSVLLVDEPSAGLDPITSAEIDKLLIDLKAEAKTTLVVVTHNIPSARRIGDEIIVLDNGNIIARGSWGDLEASDNEIVQQFLHSEGGG
jgi:phospholipid/cholesterol/gamma-HCH transport system ATP-binding protein